MPSFLDNILSIDSPDPSTSDSGADPKDLSVAGNVKSHLPAIAGSDRRKSNLDFSNLWKYAKMSGSNDQNIPLKPEEQRTDNERRSSSSFALNPVLMDKLMERFLTLALPVDENDTIALVALADRIEMQKSRPSLLVNIMARNSVLLLQRLLCPFNIIDNCIIFFDWKLPSFTIGILLIATHIVLRPSLLLILPAIVILFGVMTPHYLTVYKPDQSYVPRIFEYNPIPSLVPVSKAKAPEPIPQISREFLLNLTDLQNHMMLYVASYDFITWITEDYLFFKDEQVSVIVFLTLLISVMTSILLSPMIYAVLTRYLGFIKLVGTAMIWGFTVAMHPSFRGSIISKAHNEETRIYFLHISNAIEQRISKYLAAQQTTGELEQPEREVRVFELQKFNASSRSWEPVGYSNSYYTTNTVIRKSHVEIQQEQSNSPKTNAETPETESPQLTKKYLLLNIKPPKDFIFTGEWEIELDAEKWVKDNFVEDFVTIDSGEKWVYDKLETAPIQDLSSGQTAGDKFRRRSWVRGCRHINIHDKVEVE